MCFPATFPNAERVVTIEDAAELQLKQEHIVRLETRPPNIEGKGAVRQRQLVINSLRMRPDRIIVGEVRGEEAFDMLQAMNTGHEGSLTTVHANSQRDALSRIESMFSMANLNIPERAVRAQIASAIHAVVQIARMVDGTRKVIAICEITGVEGDMITMQDIFTFDRPALMKRQSARSISRHRHPAQVRRQTGHRRVAACVRRCSNPGWRFSRGSRDTAEEIECPHCIRCHHRIRDRRGSGVPGRLPARRAQCPRALAAGSSGGRAKSGGAGTQRGTGAAARRNVERDSRARQHSAPLGTGLQFPDAAFPGGHGNARRQHAVAVPGLRGGSRRGVAIVVGQQIVFGWAGFFLGALLPYSYASYTRGKRFQKFEELFPEAIDTLARAVRAGHAFTTAIEMIANEVSEPIASEFRKLFEEQKFGMPVRDALLNLAERVPLVDVKFFVTAVMLQRETGGNLAEILDNLSYMIRERFKILRQVRVFTAQGRLTMLLLMALPPVIVVVMLHPKPELHPSVVCRSAWVIPPSSSGSVCRRLDTS